jgi:uncharacterized protein (DUF1015 family)
MRNDGLRLAPFRGVRYVPDRVGSLAAVTSPPYDVVVRPDGLHELQTADPYNIVRLILPQAADAATGHRDAAQTLDRWRREGILAQDEEPAFYVYEQRNGDLLQRGLIGNLRLSRPEDKIVLPHEDVMPEIVAERAALLRETAANLEPLLLCYRSDGTGTGAAAVLERAARQRPILSTATPDGFSHRLWRITDPGEQGRITDDLTRRSALIGDGHHRWATYLRLSDEHGGRAPWDRGLVLLVDTARYPLQVRAIHRVLPRLAPAKALALLNGTFRVRPLPGPLPCALRSLEETNGNAFVLAGDGAFQLIDRPDPQLLDRTVPADRPRPWRRLDATVLHATLLDTLWQIPDHSADIGYIHDAEAAVAQAARLGGTAVLLRPVSEAVVRELAERGITMPRKSTSFGPKPATGLVLRSIED